MITLPTAFLNAATLTNQAASNAASEEIIDVSLFQDSIRHWQKKNGRDRTDPRFEPQQYLQIADNMLLVTEQGRLWAEREVAKGRGRTN